jgi:hypothetical protein
MLKTQHNLANRYVCNYLLLGLSKAFIHTSFFSIKLPNRSTSLSLITHPSKHQTTTAPSLPHPIHQPTNPPTLQPTKMARLPLPLRSGSDDHHIHRLRHPTPQCRAGFSGNPAPVLDERYFVGPHCETICTNNAGCAKGGPGCRCIFREKPTYSPLTGKTYPRFGNCVK